MPPEPWEKLIFPSPKSLKGVQKLLFLAKSLCIMPKYGCIQIPWWPAVLVVRMLCFAKYRCYLHAGHSAGRSQCQVAAQNPADSTSASVSPLSPGPGPGPGNDDKLPVSNQICPLYSLFREESQHQMLLISQFTECFLYRVDAQQ